MKPEELQARMAHGDAIAVLDVRTKDARRANPVEITRSMYTLSFSPATVNCLCVLFG